MHDLLITIVPALTTGFFGIVLWWLQKADRDRREVSEKNHQVLDRIEKNVSQLQQQDVTLQELQDSVHVSEAGVRVLMRYMLLRYHATYMMRGYITSHEKQEFLETFLVYTQVNGNGTGVGWKEDVEKLPVRDDLPTINPYLEILKKNKHEEELL